MKENLKKIIKDKATIYSSKPITLSSGRKTRIYFDLRTIVAEPRILMKIANTMIVKMLKMRNIKSIGGMESGAIPIVTTMAHMSSLATNPLTSFYVRKNPKAYGLKKEYEGIIKSPALIIDDIIMSGNSVIKALKIVNKNSFTRCTNILCVIYRGTDKEKKKLEKKYGVKLSYLFREKDLIK